VVAAGLAYGAGRLAGALVAGVANSPATLVARATPSPRPFLPKPSPPWSPAERADLQRTLARIFSDPITSSSAGIAVVSADGKTLFGRRETHPVTPASTLKLVVAATAINALGPKYRFLTKFVAAQPVQADGSLRGNLWLVGGGDPSLTSDDLRRGVGALARAGVRQVDGEALVDATSFSGPEQNPRWESDDLDYDYAGGTSAIALDDGVVEFDVTPGASGAPATVTTVPESEAISLSGTIDTVPSWGSTFVTIERKPDPPPHVASGQRANAGASDVTPIHEPHVEYVVDGRIAQGETQRYFKPSLGIAGYVGGVVAAMLADRRIALVGGYGVGPAPADATVLWTHPSAPLERIVRGMLVDSDNHVAEMLLRAVGETKDRPGSDVGGIAVEQEGLARLGVPFERMRVFDGSGLAPDDRIMPVTLAKLLAAEAGGPYGDAYVRALPLAGEEGTVKHHDLHEALGRARAKSGHINDVNALAGYVVTRHHGRVSFAIEVNGPDANATVVYEAMDRALDALARY
jgi:D-alanyl-D-alanine carboxypeptidase/D-alanyl-D-alanine-endopeptidase (penicillin-binding protein 4)